MEHGRWKDGPVKYEIDHNDLEDITHGYYWPDIEVIAKFCSQNDRLSAIDALETFNDVCDKKLDNDTLIQYVDGCIDRLNYGNDKPKRPGKIVMDDESISWRPQDSHYLDLVRQGYPNFARLEMMLSMRFNRSDADSLIELWIDECSNKDVELIEIQITDIVVPTKKQIDKASYRAPRYVFRYKDEVWTGSVYPFSDGLEIARPNSKGYIKPNDLDQVWKIIKKS